MRAARFASPSGAPRPGVEPRNILLAGDNAVNQMVAVRLLEKAGHSVQVVANGKEAVERAASASFGIVVMDCQMPVMDGFEAAGLIRGNERGSRIPILALTAYAMTGDRERCLEAGMDDYITKPVDGSTRIAKVAHLTQPRPPDSPSGVRRGEAASCARNS